MRPEIASRDDFCSRIVRVRGHDGTPSPARELTEGWRNWRRLKAVAGEQRWGLMCQLALIVRRQAGGWGSAPLAHEDEHHLRHWLARFDKPKALKEERFRAHLGLIEVASASTKTPLLAPDGAPTEQSYKTELKRCLAGERWHQGPWVVEALDRLCHTVLTEAEPATPDEATAGVAESRNPDQKSDPLPKKTRDGFLYGLKEEGVIPGAPATSVGRRPRSGRRRNVTQAPAGSAPAGCARGGRNWSCKISPRQTRLKKAGLTPI